MYSEPKKYRKKPVVIEAIRWTGENWPEITMWHESSLPESLISFELDELKIKTLEGVMTANVGDWIIRGVHGEFYPCKDEIFKATYELAEPAAQEAFEKALAETTERHGEALKKLADK